MGLIFSKIWKRFFGNTGSRILMTGLDAAGKTTILYKLNLGEVESTIPRIGLNVEVAKNRSISFTVFDVVRREQVRSFWNYDREFDALIFVVDSNDRYYIDGARKNLQMMLNEEELREAPVLVIANKQDLPDAMSVAEVSDRLGLNAIRGKTWFIIGTCATKGDGLYEGLDWLSRALSMKKS